MINMTVQTIFQLVSSFIAGLGTSLLALLYFRRVRLERPPVGVFNARDVILMIVFIILLPFLYLILPTWLLIGLLCLTFSCALYITLRPFLRPRYLWPLIVFLLAGDIVVTELLLGTEWGWQIYWACNDIVVLLAVVGVSNLYVQGGMRLRQVAWLTLVLTAYDFIFATFIPLSEHLADRFDGQPLDAAIGWINGPYSSNLGIGDLLIFALFITAAYKGFGRKGAFAALGIIAVFGTIIPPLSVLVTSAFVRAGIGIAIPVQTFFGPVAFVTYYLLQRIHPERSTAQWLSLQAAEGHEPLRVVRRQSTAPVSVAIGIPGTS